MTMWIDTENQFLNSSIVAEMYMNCLSICHYTKLNLLNRPFSTLLINNKIKKKIPAVPRNEFPFTVAILDSSSLPWQPNKHALTKCVCLFYLYYYKEADDVAFYTFCYLASSHVLGWRPCWILHGPRVQLDMGKKIIFRTVLPSCL
jgi:hypothetical protein